MCYPGHQPQSPTGVGCPGHVYWEENAVLKLPSSFWDTTWWLCRTQRCAGWVSELV